MTDFVTGVCRALAHPTRRALLQALARDECDVGSLSAGSGLDQPTASKHLAALRRAGLVQVRVDGRRRCYSLTHEEIVKPLLDLLTELGGQKAGQDPGGAASGDYPPAVNEDVLLPHVWYDAPRRPQGPLELQNDP